jgi:hypothetical protein
MPIIDSDIQIRLSGGSANTNANASLGGAKSTQLAPAGLFDPVTSGEAAAGRTEYRCFYVHNANATLTLESAVAWLQANGSGQLAIGLGSSAINGTEQTVGAETSAPSGVTFSAAANEAAAIVLGSIPPGQHRAVWLRRIVGAGAAAASVTGTVRVKGDTAP